MSAMSHAVRLRELNRHEEAIALLHACLAQHPDDPEVFIELALNRMEIPGAKQQALEDVRRAVGLMPSQSYPLALQSRILCSLDRDREALRLAEDAISLEAESTFAWNAKAMALCGLSRWKDAEQAARTALGIDPDDETASNLLAHTLRLQNRLEESAGESMRRLARDPENAFSFANAGWSALQRGEVQKAQTMFMESLRLDPEMEYAREGLKESFRARSRVYRLFLRWSFFLQRFSSMNQFLLVIAVMFGFRIIRVIAAVVHPLLAIPVIIAWYFFMFGSWLANPLGNMLVLKDKVARMSLDRAEKIEAVVITTLVAGGLVTGAAGLLTAQVLLFGVGASFLMSAIPASMVFTNPSLPGRVIFGGAAVVGFLCAFVPLLFFLLGDTREEPLTAGLGITILISLGCTWLGSIPFLRRRKES